MSSTTASRRACSEPTARTRVTTRCHPARSTTRATAAASPATSWGSDGWSGPWREALEVIEHRAHAQDPGEHVERGTLRVVEQRLADAQALAGCEEDLLG